MSTCLHEKRSFVVYNGEELCLDCAAAVYDQTHDQRLYAAWELVHFRELDKQTVPVVLVPEKTYRDRWPFTRPAVECANPEPALIGAIHAEEKDLRRRAFTALLRQRDLDGKTLSEMRHLVEEAERAREESA